MALGWTQFALLYVGGAVASSLAHVAATNYFLPLIASSMSSPRSRVCKRDTPALGASGAVMACVVLYALLFPVKQLSLYGQTLEARSAAALMIVIDLVLGATGGVLDHDEGSNLEKTGVAHFAHLGGAVFAGAWYAADWVILHMLG
jgi:membrane associated rhomboid family serine protease